jgi:succinyl-CoA synthetase alpha subunit
MPIRTEILASFYQDSVVLMRIAAEIRTRAGVREAAAFMGTPSNHGLLDQIGLATAQSQAARPNDLILTVDAESEAAADGALAAAKELLTQRRQASDAMADVRPRTLESALRLLPNANLAVISVPGAYAKFEAMKAIKQGLHVFLFSDNVPLAAEIELKAEAVKRGVLCMGPDCGTAYLNGTGVGFTNVVPRGRIGCVAAAGTGLQAVASRIAGLGEGISHGIGVGGRDLSAEVGGAMSLFALEALAADPTTEAIVLISKPPHATVLPKLEALIAKIGKPVVACVLGAAAPAGSVATWVATLDSAADAVAARLAGRAWSPRTFADPDRVRARLGRLSAGGTIGQEIVGLYTGGTLAHEAHLLLDGLLGPGYADRILDLGDDQYTVGRPHPMLDPSTRTDTILKTGAATGGVLLVDLVLGRGSHPDPAAPLAAAVRRATDAAKAAGRRLVTVGAVVGTTGDPQGLASQTAQLVQAGIEILPSNAEAVRFAALLVKPDLAGALLEVAR